ncbi:hypothetical protein [Actinacidiphila paucisporea]|uniref:Uncharacterized protein n=1 Tax=Actinacidiphila paucisporea TaxID=310782 RepID=A0A1M7LKA3_9ACTN|nr:hypothetical protein [Actinacidiphila paucisporea]SHM78071.1 hypothetical protein SAMN05216499_11470 [Actinacidiphila paucisporea]
MAEQGLDRMISQLSPENRAWVEHLDGERQRQLLEQWQSEGGSTGLGSVGTDAKSETSADDLVARWRQS